MSRFAVLLIFLTCCTLTLSEVPNRLVFDHLPPTQKLNQNTVQVIHEDAYGLLWIGTQSGLHIFDGHQLMLFQNDVNSSTGLHDSFILDITSSSTGELWVATLNGISQLNRESMTFDRVLSYPFDLSSSRVGSISFDEINRKLYFASRKQLYVFDVNSRTTSLVEALDELWLIKSKTSSAHTNLLLKNKTELVDLSNNQPVKLPEQVSKKLQHAAIFEDLLVVVAGNSVFIRENDGEWENVAELSTSAANRISDMEMTDRKVLWIASQENGLYTLNTDSREVTHFNHHNTNLGKTNYRKLLSSQNRILWVGTSSKGIKGFEVSGQRFQHITLSDSDSTANELVRTINSRGEWLFIGTEQGFAKYNLENKSSVYFSQPYTVFSSVIWKDGFILSTNKGITYFDSSSDSIKVFNALTDEFPELSARSMAWYQNYLLIGTDKHGVLVFDPVVGKVVAKINVFEDGASPLILTLFIDSQNRLWVGSLSGLHILDLSFNKSSHSLDIKKRHHLLQKQLVRDIVELSAGNYLVGSHSGLIEINEQAGQNFRAITYTRDNGLSDNTIYAILSVENDSVWLSSNKGLSLFDLNAKRVINYQDIEHIGQLEFNGSAKHKTPDGSWLFGGVNGITKIEQVATPKPGVGPVWIFEIKYGENFRNAYYFPQRKLSFSEEQNVFSIRFSNTNFDSSQRPLFRYRLNNKAWILLGERNEIIFAGLDPGKYQLEVESKVGLSDWKPAQNSLTFEVVPSFWRSNLAKALYALVFTLFVGIIVWQESRRRRQARMAMERIKTNEERLTMALTASELGLWDWTPENNQISRFNVRHLFKTKDIYASFDKFDEIVHPKDRLAVQRERERFFKEKGEFDIQYRVLSEDNRWRWIHDKGKVVEVDNDGEIVRASGTYTDITDLKRAQLESVLSNEVIRSMAEAVVVMDSDRKVAFVNPAFCRMTGYSSETIVHNHLRHLRSAKHGERFYDKFWEEFDKEGNWFGELWIRCENGKDILCSLEAFHISDDELEEYLSVLIFNNITEKRRAEEELSYLARYDALTGLPNRNLFNDRLEHAIALAKRHEHKLAVMFIDLDGFKKINDSYGHHAGDALLKRTAEIIRSCIRDEDTLARLSGDEFILIIEDYKETEQLKVVLNKILSKLQQPMEIVQNKVVISCSIGVSQYPKDGSDADSLMKFADTAMYHAKERGKNQYFFYREEMHRKLIHRISVENYLRDAVVNDEFYLVYQPIIDIASEKIVAAEALIRWRNPQLGEVLPIDFIPLAEESGHILEIGRFVFRKVCQSIAYWKDKYQLKVKVAVNVSVRQLMDSGFVGELESLLKEYKIESNLLKVEVTESMLMVNAGKANQILNELKSLGTTIAIDDFGTGYSSLSYLRRFAIDELKIDKEFISDIKSANQEETIVNAIIALAQSLNLKVVAEGVETEQQLRYLAQHSCDYAQGFYFSKPCEMSDFEALLLERP